MIKSVSNLIQSMNHHYVAVAELKVRHNNTEESILELHRGNFAVLLNLHMMQFLKTIHDDETIRS